MDQISLWDEPTIESSQEDEPSEHGRWVRVQYVDDYTPTPGLITGRDVYNAWCVSQQATAKMLREFYGYHMEADSIEHNIWIWNGLGPDKKKQFERMAAHLMETILPQEESK